MTLSSTPVFKFVVKIYIFVEKTLYLNFLLFYTVSPFLGVGWGLTTESYRITVPFDDLAGKKPFCSSFLSSEFGFLYSSNFIHGPAQLVFLKEYRIWKPKFSPHILYVIT